MLKNRFFLASLFFIIWVTVIDKNNVINQVQLHLQIYKQREKIEYYNTELAKINKEKENLFGNQSSLEKFAREKYMMKKDGEDLFIFIPENSNKTN